VNAPPNPSIQPTRNGFPRLHAVELKRSVRPQQWLFEVDFLASIER